MMEMKPIPAGWALEWSPRPGWRSYPQTGNRYELWGEYGDSPVPTEKLMDGRLWWPSRGIVNVATDGRTFWKRYNHAGRMLKTGYFDARSERKLNRAVKTFQDQSRASIAAAAASGYPVEILTVLPELEAARIRLYNLKSRTPTVDEQINQVRGLYLQSVGQLVRSIELRRDGQLAAADEEAEAIAVGIGVGLALISQALDQLEL